MNIEQVKKLTDDELLIKVAELLGWRRSTWAKEGYTRGAIDGEVWIARGSKKCETLGFNEYGEHEPFPYYPQDLNACSEMKDIVSNVSVYCSNLAQVIRADNRAEYGCSRHTTAPTLDQLTFATARQRCEAFVLTMES